MYKVMTYLGFFCVSVSVACMAQQGVREVSSPLHDSPHPARLQRVMKEVNVPALVDFFKCHTRRGKHLLDHLLHLPLSSLSADTALKKRTSIIKKLVESPELKQKVESLLSRVRECDQRRADLAPINHPFISLTEAKIVASLGALLSTAMLIKYIRLIYRLPSSESLADRVILYGVTGWLSVVCATFFCLPLLAQYERLSQGREFLSLIHTIITLGYEAQRLYDLSSLIPEYPLSDDTDKELAAFIKALEHLQDQTPSGWAFDMSHVDALLAPKNISIRPFFAILAELDVYNALASKIIESSASERPFCFVSHEKGESSRVMIKGGWNIHTKKLMKDEIDDDEISFRSKLKIGYRTSSTRAVFHTILLSQTFGIAAARECSMPMFYVF